MQNLLDTRQAARLCGISPRTLEKFRVLGGGPRFIKLGRRLVRYRRSDLVAWLRERERRSTADWGVPRKR